MDAFRKLWDLVVARKDAEPALPQMRLAPEEASGAPCMIQFFTWESERPDMSWWKHFEELVPDLNELGFTQVWLPPPHKATRKEGQGYDAYDLWDLGEFDQKGTVATRWGTKEELLQATAVAKAHNIDVLIDAVLNHKMGADRSEKFNAIPVNPENRLVNIGPAREIEAWTAFDFAGRGDKYSSLKWNYKHFSGVDWDDKSKSKGVYRIPGPKRKGWNKRVDSELGNYDYLLGVDIDHLHPEAAADLLAWGSWVLETTAAEGFRLDAIKHMDHKFLRQFIKDSRNKSDKPRMFSVAEYWSANINLVLPYVRIFQGLTSFFDVPLHENFHQASKKRAAYDLRKIFDKTLVKIRPGDAVTFVDNHDTQIGQSLESWVGSNFKLQAYALILLRGEGHPCAFYGDLYPNDECYDEIVAQGLRVLLRFRGSDAFFAGGQVDHWDSKNCVGWVGGNATKYTVLINNSDPVANGKSHTIEMFVKGGGSEYKNLMTPEERIRIDETGQGQFTCGAGKVAIWVPADFAFKSDNSGSAKLDN